MMHTCPKCKHQFYDREYKAKIRESHPNAFQPWSHQENIKLTELARAGVELVELVDVFGRQPNAIKKRLELLGVTIMIKEVIKEVKSEDLSLLGG